MAETPNFGYRVGMSDSAHTPEFFDAIHAYFLELTGRGVVLSSRDLTLLSGWREAGVSVAIICQGIDNAVRDLKNPRDIWSCRKHIEPLVERAGRLAVGRPEAPLEALPDNAEVEEPAFALLNAAMQGCEREAFQEAYSRALAKLQPEPDFGLLMEIDQLLVEAFFESLTEAEKREVDAFVSRGVDLSKMPEAARENHTRARRRRALIDRFGLKSVLD